MVRATSCVNYLNSWIINRTPDWYSGNVWIQGRGLCLFHAVFSIHHILAPPTFTLLFCIHCPRSFPVSARSNSCQCLHSIFWICYIILSFSLSNVFLLNIPEIYLNHYKVSFDPGSKRWMNRRTDV